MSAGVATLGAAGGLVARPRLSLYVESPALLPLVAGGDNAAVKQCIARYGGLVWSLAQRMCSSHAEAEDAVQDIFIELWKVAGRFDANKASEKTFVAMIARRRLIDRLRAKGRRPHATPFEEEAAPPTAGRDGARDIERKAEAALAAGVLAGLRDEQRRALELAVLYGLTHSEIAEAMNIPLGTAKTHVRKAVAKVREQLLAGDSSSGRRAS